MASAQPPARTVYRQASRPHTHGVVTGALAALVVLLAAGVVFQTWSGRLNITVRRPVAPSAETDAAGASGQVLTQTIQLTEPALTSGYTTAPRPAPTLQLFEPFIQREGEHMVARGRLTNGNALPATGVRLIVTFRDASGRRVDSDQILIDQVSPGVEREWGLGVGYRPTITRADVRVEWEWDVSAAAG